MDRAGRHELGTVAASEAVLEDLYVSLRRSIAAWAAVTRQTPQARMGYIGQHLTSVVTSLPGGRSGARGKDLLLPGGGHAEIKTCSRVDQLGACRECRQAVASIEASCAHCGSTAIDRKDDSKWLIGPRSETELADCLVAEHFYLVLFDFADFADPKEIDARIWRVDPRSPGFALALADYYFNIRSASRSKAPFNLWPFSFKFGLLGGELIYSARIHDDDTIETRLFPGALGRPTAIALAPLHHYARSTALTLDALQATGASYGLKPAASKAEAIAAIEEIRGSVADDRDLADSLARNVYGPRLNGHLESLPEAVRRAIQRNP